jgi:Sulfite oxidase and related enzymes
MDWQRTLLECDLERRAVAELLAQVKPKPNVTTVLFRAADGYYETFRFEKAMEPTTLVAYEMNGEPLPQGHGFPLRSLFRDYMARKTQSG